MIEIKNVIFSYDKADEDQESNEIINALDGINLTIRDGEFITI